MHGLLLLGQYSGLKVKMPLSLTLVLIWLLLYYRILSWEGQTAMDFSFFFFWNEQVALIKMVIN